MRDLTCPAWRRLSGLIAAGACLALAACAPQSLIVLQNPTTGQIVPCGPPPGATSADPAADARRCAVDYERRGYREIPLDTNPLF